MRATALATMRTRRALDAHGLRPFPKPSQTTTPRRTVSPGHAGRTDDRVVVLRSTMLDGRPVTTVKSAPVPGAPRRPVPERAVFAMRQLADAHGADVDTDQDGWPVIVWPASYATVPSWRPTAGATP